jgi:hypothetical protein
MVDLASGPFFSTVTNAHAVAPPIPTAAPVGRSVLKGNRYAVAVTTARSASLRASAVGDE